MYSLFFSMVVWSGVRNQAKGVQDQGWWIEKMEKGKCQTCGEETTLWQVGVRGKDLGNLCEECSLDAARQYQTMKAVVVFDTRYGKTERIARSLETGLKKAGIETLCVNARDVDLNSLKQYDLILRAYGVRAYLGRVVPRGAVSPPR